MNKNRINVEVNSLAEDGTFEGLLSVYNVVDLVNDVVEPGAFTKTINERGAIIPLLWQHKTDEPIGTLELTDTADALHVKGKLLLDLPEAKKAYLLLKSGVIKGLSIGFKAIKSQVVSGVRHLKECALFEGSIVTFAALPEALITSIKALESKADFNQELAAQQLFDAGYQIRCALGSALSSILYADLSKDEKIAATEDTIQQFHDAYMAYLPAYLNMLAELYGDAKNWNEIQTKANHTTLSTIQEQLKRANDLLSALSPTEAGTTTSQETAAATEQKSEPIQDHSAALTIVQSMRSLFSQA